MNRALPDPIKEPTISALRAAMILGVGRSTLYAMVARNECPAIHIGQRTVRIPTQRFIDHFGLAGVHTDDEQG